MSDDKHELGRRAEAAPGFRWMQGMWSPPRPDHPDDIGFLVLWVDDTRDDRLFVIDEDGDVGEIDATGRYPDFADPATMGGLLALVREAYQDPAAYAQDRGPDGWWVWQSDPRGGTLARGWGSEAEALVRALEAATPTEVDASPSPRSAG